LVLFDGEVYGGGPDSLVPTPTILNNLIARRKIPPIVAVLVNRMSQGLRERDLACWKPFMDFLTEELVPRIRKEYNISLDPAETIVGGSSFGGLAATCSALTHPDVFGNVLSQSGSYWYVPDWRKETKAGYSTETGWVISEFANKPRLPLRFYLEVGRLESQFYALATNRHLRDILRLKGYPVTYSEYNGGHDYLCWRGSLADGLVALLQRPDRK